MQYIAYAGRLLADFLNAVKRILIMFLRQLINFSLLISVSLKCISTIRIAVENLNRFLAFKSLKIDVAQYTRTMVDYKRIYHTLAYLTRTLCVVPR